MPVPTFSGYRRPTTAHKLSAAGIAATGVAALAFAVVPGFAAEQAPPAAKALSANPVTEPSGKLQKESLTEQSAQAAKKAAEAKKKAEAEAEARQRKAATDMAQKKAAYAKAQKERAAKEAASRAQARKPVAPAYPNNLDGWIRESLAIMKQHGIPGSYQGIHRNVMRESGGNPRAINNWDVNAQNGVPSKGLLQVIKPTFDAYHVSGTPWDQYDPVANITAACNYAADRYGSIDNVNSAY
ncbi:transglycosylase SLT domain-containing protein [Streptomyces sp. KR80]|uniref:transglycosylase SLT domain-containing protein n=1 Tax=Streptomyces sp. KR80 TaxID=3457426 RepID=UPI003FD3244B